MELERLCKEKFVSPKAPTGEPSIRFYSTGVVHLNRMAVKHLKLLSRSSEYGAVSFFIDPKCKNDIFICKDTEGWPLRRGNAGGAMFNNCNLARHIIDVTWNKCVSHPVGSKKPSAYTFKIARVAFDDDGNKDKFALIRKNQ